MGHKFAEIAFTKSVKAIQTEQGSRNNYAAMEGGDDYNNVLGQAEIEFITQRDSFYMASVSETRWPYVQHRGGPQGFVKILDEQSIGFADYSGNRQYVSVGNFNTDNRVSLFFMDYPNRRRLKVFGRVRVASLEEHEVLGQLEDGHYRAQIERGIIITIEGYDWNCPQFITPRLSEAEVATATHSLRDEIQRLQEIAANSHSGEAEVSLESESKVLGSGPLHLCISGVKQLTPSIRAYELRNIEGGKLPAFGPGSHLRIPISLGDGSLSNREYSISSDPERRDYYEIAVNHDKSGRGGSTAVHTNFVLGTEFKTGLPINQFPLHPNAGHMVLIAGGIGITPIKSMMHVLAVGNKDFQLFYAGKSTSELAYYDDLHHEFPGRVRFFSSAENNRLDVAKVLDSITESTDIYVCGPDRLLEDVLLRAKEKGISRQQIKFEKFS